MLNCFVFYPYVEWAQKTIPQGAVQGSWHCRKQPPGSLWARKENNGFFLLSQSVCPRYRYLENHRKDREPWHIWQRIER